MISDHKEWYDWDCANVSYEQFKANLKDKKQVYKLKRPFVPKDSNWTPVKELAQEFNECLAISIEYLLWWDAIPKERLSTIPHDSLAEIYSNMAASDRSHCPETRKKLLNEIGGFVYEHLEITGPDL